MAGATVIVNAAPIGTTFKTGGAIWVGATARRIQLYEAEFSQAGTLSSTDCQEQWDLSRFSVTASMAGAAFVPQLLDPADASPLTQAMNLFTTEPTYTGAGSGLFLKSWAINQRGSYRWRCLDDGDNILVPAVALSGLGLRSLCSVGSAFAASGVGNMSFIER